MLTADARCPLCGGAANTALFDLAHVPSHHLRLIAVADRQSDYGDLRIVACATCGHVFNAAFSNESTVDLYQVHASTNAPVHESMLRGLRGIAGEILGSAPTPQPTILEIGCGVGALARLLAEQATRVDLIEPNLSLDAAAFENSRIRLLPGFFPAASTGQRYDLVVCRQVLEHVDDPVSFLSAIRGHLAPGGRAYIEVPSMDYIAAHASPTDFHYLHIQYFSRAIMECLLTHAGLSVDHVTSIKDGHDMGFTVSAANIRDVPWPAPSESLFLLGERLTARIKAGAEHLKRMKGGVALYGACAYAQTLMGLYPEMMPEAQMFDDTESYAGHEVYCRSARLPVALPTAPTLASHANVVICAWLHDRAIAERLAQFGYKGSVFSLRSDPQVDRDGQPPSLFV